MKADILIQPEGRKPRPERNPKAEVRRALHQPARAKENSPAIYRWDLGQPAKVSAAGTKEVPRWIHFGFFRPSGTNENVERVHPAMNRWAILERPCRDCGKIAKRTHRSARAESKGEKGDGEKGGDASRCDERFYKTNPLGKSDGRTPEIRRKSEGRKPRAGVFTKRTHLGNRKRGATDENTNEKITKRTQATNWRTFLCACRWSTQIRELPNEPISKPGYVATDETRIFTDKRRMSQILNHVVGNARAFSPAVHSAKSVQSADIWIFASFPSVQAENYQTNPCARRAVQSYGFLVLCSAGRRMAKNYETKPPRFAKALSTKSSAIFAKRTHPDSLCPLCLRGVLRDISKRTQRANDMDANDRLPPSIPLSVFHRCFIRGSTRYMKITKRTH
jgi:hypothetical protein